MDQKKPRNQEFPSILRRVTEVTTDKDGKLIQPTRHLESNTEYALCEDAPVRPAKTMTAREEVVEWIDKCVLGDLRTMMLGIAERKGAANSSYLGGGNFFLAAGCCMALEYFGRVYNAKGSNATDRVQEYVERFLTPIDKRYIKVWPILWDSFRNGIIHGSWPQKICMEGSEEQIAIGADNSRDGDHLGPASDHAGKSFVISSYRFFFDIERSFNKGFRDWIRDKSDNGILERAAPPLLEIKRRNKEGKKAFEHVLSLNPQAEKNSHVDPKAEG